jgi:hypothetical protein
VVLLQDDGEGTSLKVGGRWTRIEDKDAPLRLSSTIVGEVRERRIAVLVSNPLDDPKFIGHQSIVDLNLRSAMAAPLFDNHRCGDPLRGHRQSSLSTPRRTCRWTHRERGGGETAEPHAGTGTSHRRPHPEAMLPRP